MRTERLLINGHYRQQRVTGVQLYANEIVKQFDKKNISYSWVQPPEKVTSDVLRQLWIQSVMPYNIPDDKILWSPTNIGPVRCENQVLTLHDIVEQLHPEWYDTKYVQWRRLILPKLLKRVRKIITVSHFSKRTIVERYPVTEGKIEVIYNGVQTDLFYPRGEKEKESMREKLNLHKPFILTVGTIATRKNTKGLIDAWKRLPENLRNEMNLVIAGTSAKKFAYNLDERPPDGVRFTGYIKNEQLPPLYSAATLFVFPSLFESFGLPVLEAMACGTPVITSSTTVLKEVTGNAAVCVHPESIDEIRSAIITLLDSSAQRSKMITKGLDRSSQFTWEKSAEQTYNCLTGAS